LTNIRRPRDAGAAPACDLGGNDGDVRRVCIWPQALPRCRSFPAAQERYPARPMPIIVAAAAGGAADIHARLFGQWLSDRLDQQFIIDNRPGAGNNIGTEAVVRAPADGFTLLLAQTANAISAALYDKLNFNFIRDIAPVASMVRVANIMEVHPSFPARTVPEFIALCQGQSSKINMASAGSGNPTHLAGELSKMTAGVDMVRVPYRGEASALTDLRAPLRLQFSYGWRCTMTTASIETGQMCM
jgi:tripartite-type tricarboxylate transporter receptor subunit TctC